MKKSYALLIMLALVFTFWTPAALLAQDKKATAAKAPGLGIPGETGEEDRLPIYLQVVIFDVSPGSAKEFEAALVATRENAMAEPTLINERVLRNIDEVTYQYATYSKFTDRGRAEQFLAQRTSKLQPFLAREPEVHTATLTNAYFSDGATDNPTGLELGLDRTGQIAHLGLFIPYPRFRKQYDQTLHEVKLVLKDRKSPGYMGEETAVEADLLSGRAQTPYSPQTFEPSKMSINYGEYDTMENAENAYIVRHSQHDPKLIHLERNFFSALQVPTRFFLFQVIGNYGHADAVARARNNSTVRTGGK